MMTRLFGICPMAVEIGTSKFHEELLILRHT